MKVNLLAKLFFSWNDKNVQVDFDHSEFLTAFIDAVQIDGLLKTHLKKEQMVDK